MSHTHTQTMERANVNHDLVFFLILSNLIWNVYLSFCLLSDNVCFIQKKIRHSMYLQWHFCFISVFIFFEYCLRSLFYYSNSFMIFAEHRWKWIFLIYKNYFLVGRGLGRFCLKMGNVGLQGKNRAGQNSSKFVIWTEVTHETLVGRRSCLHKIYHFCRVLWPKAAFTSRNYLSCICENKIKMQVQFTSYNDTYRQIAVFCSHRYSDVTDCHS